MLDCGRGVVNEGGVEAGGNSRTSRDLRTAGDKLSSKKCNFGIAPVCMPFSSRSLLGTLSAKLLYSFSLPMKGFFPHG